MDIKEVRELFPYLKTEKIYFNHAATGPLNEYTSQKINEYLTQRREGDMDDHVNFMKVSEKTKNDIARLINTKPDRIAFVDNTTNGINILAQGIKWKNGDRILLNELEFPANVYPFLNLKQYGVKIDFVKPKDGKVYTEDIIEMIKPETRLVAISFVQFLTGYRADITAIGKVCRERGIIFSVDAIQGLGAIKLDVDASNIDFLSSGSQKWLLGLHGLAFIYISKELQEQLQPKYAGWLSVKGAWDLLNYDLTLKDDAEAFQYGTLPAIGIYALSGSLDLFNAFGMDKVEERVLNNAVYLMNKLEQIGLKPLLADCSRENISGIVTFKHKDVDELSANLKNKNVHFAVRGGMIRLSPHFYNIPEEADAVANILKESI